MTKKSAIERQIKKARELLQRDPDFTEVVRQISKVAEAAKSVESTTHLGRLRIPYVNALPIGIDSWK